MLVSYEWLKDYINLDNISAKEFCDKMILSGSNLETCEELVQGIDGVKIGKIEKIERHPNADKLVVCQINIGSEVVQIVTGATNVYEGAIVPVALDGSTIPGPLHGQPKVEGGVKINKGELRGVLSNGMICSPEELGYSDSVVPLNSKGGIWLLPVEFDNNIGEDVVSAMGLGDYQIDFEITPNRPDCLSMTGMARETMATFDRKMVYPALAAKTDSKNVGSEIEVEVKSDFCKRYMARVIKDVKIEQSPWWLQKRLMSVGVRPINNIVDITNFVMLEYGQPLHAFDFEQIQGNKIIVDTAKAGDIFVTLDGKEIQLDEEVLMINDANRAVALAGIMGGLNSEITDDTTTMVLEIANFDEDNIRKTSKRLGKRTESSSRYEKGIDPNLCEDAMLRVCKLVEELGCGKVEESYIDIYKNPEVATPVKARVSKINSLIGIDLTREEMIAILEKLEMKVDGEGDELIVTPLTVRRDIEIEVDIVEEVARIYGYDKIPMTIPSTATKSEVSDSWKLREKVRDVLCAMGANEIMTFSFTNDKILDDTGISEDSWERETVKLINPMGEDTAAMRTVITPGMLDVLGRNFSRNIPSVRAFEIGKTYTPKMTESELLPYESYHVSVGLYGEGEDFFTLKGMVEELFESIGITGLTFEAESDYGVYHPGRCARILLDCESEKSEKIERIVQVKEALENQPGERDETQIAILTELINTIDEYEDDFIELGIMGEVHPDVSKKFGISTRVYCCELLFDLMLEFADRTIHYSPLPKYPATSRDIALLVDEDVKVGDILAIINSHKNDILEKAELFDVYRGVQVGEGKKSVAISLTYRHAQKTLTDAETEAVHSEILDDIKSKIGAVLRDS